MGRWLLLVLSLASACVGVDATRAVDAGTEIDAGDAGPVNDGDVGDDAAWPSLHVLFIGNSLTFVNDLPGMLSHMAATAGQPPLIETEEVVQGGATLGRHKADGIAEARIGKGGLTHVVIQGQSDEPLASINFSGAPDDFTEDATWFGQLAETAGAVPVYFDTWAYLDGSDVVPAFSGAITIDREIMQDYLTQAYAQAASSVPNGLVACAGEAFRFVLDYYPGIAPQQADGTHPSLAGTYLAAATFYVVLTNQSVPVSSEVPSGLDPNDAATLRQIALVFGSQCKNFRSKPYIVISPCGDMVTDCQHYDPVSLSTSNPMTLLVQNIGGTDATDLRAGIADPFAWTESNAYPGTSDPFVYQSQSYPPCTDHLAGHAFGTPPSACAISVTYKGGMPTTRILDVSMGYQIAASVTLTGMP